MPRYKPRPRTNQYTMNIYNKTLSEALSNNLLVTQQLELAGLKQVLQYAHGDHVISSHCRVGLEWTHGESIIFQRHVSGNSNARPTL